SKTSHVSGATANGSVDADALNRESSDSGFHVDMRVSMRSRMSRIDVAMSPAASAVSPPAGGTTLTDQVVPIVGPENSTVAEGAGAGPQAPTESRQTASSTRWSVLVRPNLIRSRRT